MSLVHKTFQQLFLLADWKADFASVVRIDASNIVLGVFYNKLGIVELYLCHDCRNKNITLFPR